VDARLATEANGDVLAKYVEDGRLSPPAGGQQALPYPAMQQIVGEKCRLARPRIAQDAAARLRGSTNGRPDGPGAALGRNRSRNLPPPRHEPDRSLSVTSQTPIRACFCSIVLLRQGSGVSTLSAPHRSWKRPYGCVPAATSCSANWCFVSSRQSRSRHVGRKNRWRSCSTWSRSGHRPRVACDSLFVVDRFTLDGPPLARALLTMRLSARVRHRPS
jgi:hypothetical protein